MARNVKKSTVLLAAVFILLSGCSHAEKNIEAPSRSFNHQELTEGQTIHESIMASFYTYTDPRVTDYVSGIGKELLKGSESGGLYNFTILYNDKVYASAAPGGYIYLTTGMINFLENEAQLAAVLAHEIGSLQFQDPRVSNGRRVMEQVTQGVAVVSPAFGPYGALAVLGAVLVNSMVEKGEISETDKLFLSDELALHYMVNAGYDPQGYVDVLRKVVEVEKETLPYLYDYYQSHPITEERFAHLNQAFSRLPMTGKTLEIRREEFLTSTKGVREIYQR